MFSALIFFENFLFKVWLLNVASVKETLLTGDHFQVVFVPAIEQSYLLEEISVCNECIKICFSKE